MHEGPAPGGPGLADAVAGQITHDINHYFQFVTNAYQQYLGRQPDAAGLAGWVSRMQAGLRLRPKRRRREESHCHLPESHCHTGKVTLSMQVPSSVSVYDKARE
jgi:Domain of unknown function (DUF4214)